jgi:hypothetical protein
VLLHHFGGLSRFGVNDIERELFQQIREANLKTIAWRYQPTVVAIRGPSSIAVAKTAATISSASKDLVFCPKPNLACRVSWLSVVLGAAFWLSRSHVSSTSVMICLLWQSRA